ncbi:MAG: hypothetical protein L6R39_004425 [Caloplaca ligustica]|nr:MAG: hypothetical protein L6R39_004425 [Caloplaca ligustica]
MDLISPSLGAAASAARFIAQLGAVKDETGVVIEQVKVVTNDIAEAERLYLKQKHYLIDGEQSRVEEVIRNIKVAVNRIAKEVEPARKSVTKVGAVNVVDRVDWILRRKDTTETHQRSVETCHRSLLDRMNDEASSASPALNGSDFPEDSNSSGPVDRGATPTTATAHPERALYEATQMNHSRKFKMQRPAIHPERLLYEEMQQRHR